MRTVPYGLATVFLLLGCATVPGPRDFDGGSQPDRPGRVFGAEAVAEYTSLTAADRAAVMRRKVYFQHASVGANIVEGLRQVLPKLSIQSVGSYEEAKSWLSGHPGLAEHDRGNPGGMEKVRMLGQTGTLPDGTLAMAKFCYIDDDQPAKGLFEAYRGTMEGLARKNPGVTYVWWTMPVMTQGNERRNEFNELMRRYCRSHRLPLFDIADIEAGPDGNQAEKWSADGGHLNSTGQVRVAKAFVVMLSEL